MPKSKKNTETVKTTFNKVVEKKEVKKVELLDSPEARICANCKKEFAATAKWQNTCDDCK